ncbi:hypothetical protein BJX61DRAFT_324824 [Aspergillus egyptiacus]|nr:hypothetical protein BJX61DRAFT_324824 [Aspergillus egyptiacus]
MARSALVMEASNVAPTRSSKRKRATESHDEPVLTPKKPRAKRTPAASARGVKDATDTASDAKAKKPAAKAVPKGQKAPTETAERRARKFRNAPPKSFQQRLERAITQRMFVVGQTVTGTDDVPELTFDIVGTTGNLYKTVIGKEPTCSCPDARKGNQCKHICYVKVLNAPVHLQYQLAFLSPELRDIYENSPLRQVNDKAVEPDTDGKRKPVEGDCPICFMEFEPEKEAIVWCRAACGNNIHKTCFQKWAATQQGQGVRCVYCRSPWQNQDADGKVDVDLQQLLSEGRIGEDGYVNVASQMGLSGERDCSTYWRPWARQQSFYSGRRGYDYEDWYY